MHIDNFLSYQILFYSHFQPPSKLALGNGSNVNAMSPPLIPRKLKTGVQPVAENEVKHDVNPADDLRTNIVVENNPPVLPKKAAKNNNYVTQPTDTNDQISNSIPAKKRSEIANENIYIEQPNRSELPTMNNNVGNIPRSSSLMSPRNKPAIEKCDGDVPTTVSQDNNTNTLDNNTQVSDDNVLCSPVIRSKTISSGDLLDIDFSPPSNVSPIIPEKMSVIPLSHGTSPSNNSPIIPRKMPVGPPPHETPPSNNSPIIPRKMAVAPPSNGTPPSNNSPIIPRKMAVAPPSNGTPPSNNSPIIPRKMDVAPPSNGTPPSNNSPIIPRKMTVGPPSHGGTPPSNNSPIIPKKMPVGSSRLTEMPVKPARLHYPVDSNNQSDDFNSKSNIDAMSPSNCSIQLECNGELQGTGQPEAVVEIDENDVSINLHILFNYVILLFENKF